MIWRLSWKRTRLSCWMIYSPRCMAFIPRNGSILTWASMACYFTIPSSGKLVFICDRKLSSLQFTYRFNTGPLQWRDWRYICLPWLVVFILLLQVYTQLRLRLRTHVQSSIVHTLQQFTDDNGNGLYEEHLHHLCWHGFTWIWLCLLVYQLHRHQHLGCRFTYLLLCCLQNH